MSDYTFRADASNPSLDWGRPQSWQQNAVPNDANADVHVPTVTYLSNGQVYHSDLTIAAGDDFTIHSIDISNNEVDIFGALNAVGPTDIGSGGVLATYQAGAFATSGPLTIESGGELRDNGSFSVGVVSNAGLVDGFGPITAQSFTNTGTVDGFGLTINAHSFTNMGSLLGSGDANSVGQGLTINTDHDGFSGLTSGTLTGGVYGGSSLYGSVSNITINDGETITSDAATIVISNTSSIYSYDPSTNGVAPIQSTLHDITSTGHLTIASGALHFGALTDAGALTLDEGSTLSAPGIIVTNSGSIDGHGSLYSSVENDGTILATHGTTALNGSISTLYIDGQVTGTGHIEIAGGNPVEVFNGTNPSSIGYQQANLELTHGTSQDVVFHNSVGQLTLDDAHNYSGTIHVSSADIANGPGDQIILTNVAPDSVTGTTYAPTQTGGDLTLNGANPVTLHFAGDVNQNSFTVGEAPRELSSDPHAVQVTVHANCFAGGTRILTVDGQVTVDALRIGDQLVTSGGEARPVIWLGRRVLTGLDDPKRAHLRPVRVRAGALGEGVPTVDVLLSSGHAVCLDVMGEIFVPVGRLVNGATIDVVAVDTITYWHVELEDHDVIFADGLRAESYMDVGNRRWFSGDDFVEAEQNRVACARPIYAAGPVLSAVRARIDERAQALGWTRSVDLDPHLVVDGASIASAALPDGLRFTFPASAREVSFRSATFVPRHDDPDADPRELGLPLLGMDFSGVRVELDDPALFELHPIESDGEHAWRWTAGSVHLNPRLWAACDGEVVLQVALMPMRGERQLAPAAMSRAKLIAA